MIGYRAGGRQVPVCGTRGGLFLQDGLSLGGAHKVNRMAAASNFLEDSWGTIDNAKNRNETELRLRHRCGVSVATTKVKTP